MRALSIPTIAAVHGHALAGGFELALECDIRIAATDAVFGLPDTAIGLSPTSGMSFLLPRVVGEGWARDLLLTGRWIDAAVGGADRARDAGRRARRARGDRPGGGVRTSPAIRRSASPTSRRAPSRDGCGLRGGAARRGAARDRLLRDRRGQGSPAGIRRARRSGSAGGRQISLGDRTRAVAAHWIRWIDRDRDRPRSPVAILDQPA